jgi:hypothetical protein
VSLPSAEGVMAATHKLVQQAMSGQWHEVPKTVEQRRVMMEQLAANAAPQDQQWLSALRQAMAESDAAVAKIAPAGAVQAPPAPRAADSGSAVDQVAFTLDMIGKSR